MEDSVVKEDPPPRVLVCVDHDCESDALVRYGAALAARLRAPWTVLHVETSRERRPRSSNGDRLADCLHLAGQLGGEALELPAEVPAEEILAYARANGVTDMVIGNPKRAKRFNPLRRCSAHRLIETAPDIALHIAPRATEAEDRSRPASTRPPRRIDALGMLVGIALVALTTVFGVALLPFVQPFGIAVVYLIAVMITAAQFGLASSLVASVLAVLAFDFFMLQPLYTFEIDNPRDVVAFLFFVVVAFVTSNVSSRLRRQMLVARHRARTMAALYSFSRSVASAVGLDELLPAILSRVATMLKTEVVLLLVSDGKLVKRAQAPGHAALGAADLAAADRIWRTGIADNRAGDGTRWRFLPLRTAHATLGVVGVARSSSHHFEAVDARKLLEALVDQSAVAIERVVLAAEIEETRVLRETERLRSALLTSVSHDFRTPLASVLGALAGLRDNDMVSDPAIREELIDTAQEEAERLNRFVGNLLDITRLEAHALELNCGPVDLADVVGSALRRAEKLLQHHQIATDLHFDLPMLRLDFVLFEQVLFNLLDNAAKYSPCGTTISIVAIHCDNEVILQIADEGRGIPPADLERVFSKFHRLNAADQQRAGTGLGLAICRGFVEAQGGTIIAGNRPERSGAVFTITLPVAQAGAAPFSASTMGELTSDLVPASVSGPASAADNPRPAR